MKKCIFSALFVLNTLLVFGQFSLGSDLVAIGLAHLKQKEMGLMPDTLLPENRLVFTANSGLVGAYKYKQWEFSLGVGYEYCYWKQKFEALTPDVKIFVGSDSQSDSSDYLAKITYTSRRITIPFGAKYFFGRKPDSWVDAFVAVRFIPTFAYQGSADPGFFDRPVTIFYPFRVRRAEDPALVAATEAYFKPKMNTFMLDTRAELGFRLWGRNHSYCADFSVGWLHGFKPIHQQMGLNNGYFGNLALRFYFKNSSKTEGLF